jgi:hypothetical protein
LILPEEDRALTGAKWRGGYRWFRRLHAQR